MSIDDGQGCLANQAKLQVPKRNAPLLESSTPITSQHRNKSHTMEAFENTSSYNRQGVRRLVSSWNQALLPCLVNLYRLASHKHYEQGNEENTSSDFLDKSHAPHTSANHIYM